MKRRPLAYGPAAGWLAGTCALLGCAGPGPASSLLEGRASAAVVVGLDERTLWEQARALRDRDAQAAAAAAGRALDAGSGPLAAEHQRLAFEMGRTLALDFAGALALELQAALHRRVDAPWSAQDLAHTLARLDRAEEAERLLAEALVRWPREGELWNERGLVALGAGDLRTARRHLEAAWRRGSVGAALTLGRLELAAGSVEAARTRWVPLLALEPPPDWAVRGWGLALLGCYPGAVRE